MYNIILNAHSGWAFVVLITLVIASVNSLIGYTSKRDFSPNDKRLALFGLIATHVQVLFGIILYFVSPLGFHSVGEMGNATLRLTSMEHPLTNIIAITLITIGWSKHKKLVDSTSKFKTIMVFYAIGLLLLLSRIPWSNWF
jgi:hypothetical protein